MKATPIDFTTVNAPPGWEPPRTDWHRVLLPPARRGKNAPAGEDLTPKTFGAWTVTGPTVKVNGDSFIPCQCSCMRGPPRLVIRSQLLGNKSRQCRACADAKRYPQKKAQ